MKKIREIAKESTRALILDKTKELIVSKGILKTSTKQISDYCNVAHGTIFSHFNNREQLISSVIKRELIRIAKALYKLEDLNVPFDQLLDKYLSLVAKEENLLAILNKEFPFLSDGLKREIVTTESIVKKLFYNRIEQGIHENIFKPMNISVILSFLFGTIQHYLIRKELFIDSGSIIKKKKNEIINIFLTLLN